MLDMTNLPSRQLQSIRNKLRSKATMIMAKKSTLHRAFESCKNKDVAKLNENLNGIPALILTDLGAFQLFQILKQNQSPAPAKVGQISPKDIEIKAGPTSIAPGPAISTFSMANVPAGVEDGKIAVKKDTMLVKEGDEFTKQMVDLLNLLGIEPMLIGIKLAAALDNGEVFTADLLDINVEEFISKIALAHNDSFKLAIGANIVTPATATFLITRAELDAKALAIETGILADETKANVLAKIENQAKALQEKVSNNQ
jgi:large subunit ribosomal protein L10